MAFGRPGFPALRHPRGSSILVSPTAPWDQIPREAVPLLTSGANVSLAENNERGEKPDRSQVDERRGKKVRVAVICWFCHSVFFWDAVKGGDSESRFRFAPPAPGSEQPRDRLELVPGWGDPQGDPDPSDFHEAWTPRLAPNPSWLVVA